MKAYLVTYSGLWLGGEAVALANSAEEAIALVKSHPRALNFTDVQAEEIAENLNTPLVLLNDNGDY
jgi:hypothetical protein